jgi:transmembrane sensor
VFEGAVLIKPKEGQGTPLTLHAGEAVDFTTAEAMQKGVAEASSTLWSQGFIIVDQLSMGELIAELSRYRKGFLQCDPRVAHLMVSGSFPTDTDAALEILTHKFPIKINTFTRYWIKVEPA